MAGTSPRPRQQRRPAGPCGPLQQGGEKIIPPRAALGSGGCQAPAAAGAAGGRRGSGGGSGGGSGEAGWRGRTGRRARRLPPFEPRPRGPRRSSASSVDGGPSASPVDWGSSARPAVVVGVPGRAPGQGAHPCMARCAGAARPAAGAGDHRPLPGRQRRRGGAVPGVAAGGARGLNRAAGGARPSRSGTRPRPALGRALRGVSGARPVRGAPCSLARGAAPGAGRAMQRCDGRGARCGARVLPCPGWNVTR